MDEVETAFLWLEEWKMLRTEENYRSAWMKLPKGTHVRLLSTQGLLALSDAVEAAVKSRSTDPLADFHFPNTDIFDPNTGGIVKGMEPNVQYTIVPESTFQNTLVHFAADTAINAWVVWNGALKPEPFISGQSLVVIECLENRSIKHDISIVGDMTVRDVANEVSKTWREREGWESLHPTIWTSRIRSDCSTFENQKLPHDFIDSDFTEITNRDMPIFEALNSSILFLDHRVTLMNVQLTSKKTCLGVGLENMGQTCFLNAVLQCLAHLPTFVLFLMYEYPAVVGDETLADMIKEMLLQMYMSQSGVITPAKILAKLSLEHAYESRTQQDANELFHVLLEVLSKDIPPRQLPQPPVSPYLDANFWLDNLASDSQVRSELFGGVQRQRLRCGLCQHEEVRYVSFCSLPLDLPQPRSFSVTVVRQDLSKPQEVLKLESQTSLEENEILHNITEKVKEMTRIADIIVGENRRMLLENTIGLSNMITCSSFVALEMPPLDANSCAIFVDFYMKGRSEDSPLCTRILALNKSVKLSTLKSDVIFFLVQVEENASRSWKQLWLRSSAESVYKGFIGDAHLEFISVDENRTPVSVEQLTEHGMDTLGDLCWNLDGKIPRFRLTTGNYSAGAINSLRLPVPASSYSWLSFFSQGPDSSLTITLHQMMKYNFREKPLNEEDSFYCSNCNQRTQHIATLEVARFPRLLALTFQRVRIDCSGLSKSAIRIQYPLEELELSELELGKNVDPPVYDLQAVLMHDGRSLKKGHYLALALNPLTQTWVRYNDKTVESVDSLEAIQEQAAYMLFYSRRFS